jgi:hypothetical protein
MFKDLKFVKDEQAFHFYMQGDKTKQAEPPEVNLHFPGGHIGVARCSDGTYWAHFCLEGQNKDDGSYDMIFKGKLIGLRIDNKDRPISEMNCGDLAKKDFYHLAIKIQPLKKDNEIPF